MAKDQPAEGTSDTETTTPDPEPTEAPDGAQIDQEASQDTFQEVKPQTSGADQAKAEAAGFHGAISQPEDSDPFRTLTAGEAAPSEDAALAEAPDGFTGIVSDDRDKIGATPLADLPGYPRALTQTPETRKGYLGEVPTSHAEREAMSLKGQAAVAREQYGDGNPEKA